MPGSLYAICSFDQTVVVTAYGVPGAMHIFGTMFLYFIIFLAVKSIELQEDGFCIINIVSFMLFIYPFFPLPGSHVHMYFIRKMLKMPKFCFKKKKKS